MVESSDFRITKMPLNHGAGHMSLRENSVPEGHGFSRALIR
jgi:hypothetical protein